MRSPIVLAAAAALVDVAAAHYRWTSLIANGTKSAEYYYVRQNNNHNSPLLSVSTTDLRCNSGAQASASNTNIATVTAGSTVGMALDQGIYHIGPIMVYMSKSTTADVKSYDGSGQWFKVSELGPTIGSAGLTWPSANLAQYTFTLPKSLPNGQYLLRFEQVGLHQSNAPQFYISCAHVNVVGGGSGTPGPTAQIPGVYSSSDPGLFLNPYYPVPTSYKMPGPAVWKG